MSFSPSGISANYGIVGRVVAPAETKFDGKLVELRIAVDHGYKDKQSVTQEWKKTGTTFLTYSASGDYGDLLKEAGQGDLVKISGSWSIEAPEFKKKDGTTDRRVVARWGDFEILERKGEGKAASENTVEKPF